MKRVFFGALLVFGFLAGSCWGADFSFLLNDNSAQANLDISLDKNEYGSSFGGIRVLYNDKKETLLGSLSGGVSGEPGDIPGLKLGVEILGNLGTSKENNDLLSLGLGLLASYQPPQLQGFGTYVRGQWTPELLSFLDCEGMVEGAFGVSYMVMPKATLKVEYQVIEADFKDAKNQDIDESLRVGVVFHF